MSTARHPLVWVGLIAVLAAVDGRSRCVDAEQPPPPAAEPAANSTESGLETVRVSADGTHFVLAPSGRRFVVWGVNYDHDAAGRLLDEYWFDEWSKVEEDFREIRELGANCVRIHLQLGKFMATPEKADTRALAQLRRLLKLAESLGLYLDVTGLACYHKANIPPWYDTLPEAERWAVQARFWEAVAGACTQSPVVFCYDLMNEPIVPGKKPATEWLTGELGGKFFVQRIALDRRGRTPRQIARDWVDRMVDAIRRHDRRHLVTVGVIPWVYVFGGGQPLFHHPEVGGRLDFVAVHFYPEKGHVDRAVKTLRAYEVGKPLLIEEMFPLKCGIDELMQFVERSAAIADGWVSFYWGEPPEVLQARPDKTIADAIVAAWLKRFRAEAPRYARPARR